MMMNYHSRDKQRRKVKLFFVILLILVLIFYSQVTSVINGVLKSLVYPIWVTENNITDSSINPFGYFMPKKNLMVSNEQLKKDLNEAEIMLADRNLLLKENLELKEIIGRKETRNLLLASILSKPNNSPYDSLVIDAGDNFGIKKGDRVFAIGNILIGEISKVGKKTSRVTLYSSPKEKTEVLVGIFNIEGVAVGRGSGNFEIKLPRDTNVNIDDPVFVTGMNPSLLCVVEEIIKTPIEPFKTLLLKSPVNLFGLKWVQVSKSE